MRCFMCGTDVPSHSNVCEDCEREIQEQERMQEDRERWEREQMEDHYRRHPHG